MDRRKLALFFVTVSDRKRSVQIHFNSRIDDSLILVASPTGSVASAADTFLQNFLRNLQGDHSGNLHVVLGQQLIQCFGLRNGSWEAIEYETFDTGSGLDLIIDH